MISRRLNVQLYLDDLSLSQVKRMGKA